MCDENWSGMVDAQVRHGICDLDAESILAVDPGGTTGLAWVAGNCGEGCVAELDGRCGWGELAVAQSMAMVVERLEVGCLVFEDFLLTPGNPLVGGREGVSPIRVTYGVLGLLQGRCNLEIQGGAWDGWGRNGGGAGGVCVAAGNSADEVAGRRVAVRFQTAALAKTTMTDQRLERRGYGEFDLGHATDAMRHLLTAQRVSGLSIA